MKVFISGTAGFGSKAITILPKDVKNYICELAEKGVTFLVGDCQGVDMLVQQLLNEINYNNIAVYCSGNKCRNIVNNSWHIEHISVPRGITGRDFFAVKDNAMAKSADFGIAIWDGKSKGTGNNIRNLTAQGKTVFVYRTDKNEYEAIQ